MFTRRNVDFPKYVRENVESDVQMFSETLWSFLAGRLASNLMVIIGLVQQTTERAMLTLPEGKVMPLFVVKSKL